MKTYTHTEKMMGTIFSMGVVAEKTSIAQQFLSEGINEIKRLEALLSEFKADSMTSKINQNASEKWVTTDIETFQLIKRSIAISQLSKGAFDITVSPLKKLYRFDKATFEMPEQKHIEKALKKTGYKKIAFDETACSVKFLANQMAISFSAIGKGFAADKVIALWKNNGLESGYVNASGDIRAIGKNEKNEFWKVGVANPESITSSIFQLPLSNNAIATSGNSEQHFLYKGKKYSHNINPFTGKPLQGIKSVTVVSPSAELSDALATAVYVKGVKNGIGFIDQLPQTHAIIIDKKNKVHFSKKINYEVHNINPRHLLAV